MREIRVLYVEDDLMLRGLLAERIVKHVAELAPELALCWDLAGTLEDAMAKVDLSPDVLLLELELKGGHPKHAGLRVLERARALALWVPAFVMGDWLHSEVACKVQALHAHVVPRGAALTVSGLAELFVQCVRSPYDRLAPILAATREPLDDKMDAIQAAIVRHAMCQCSGNKSAAARALGVTRQSSRLRLDEAARPPARPQEMSRTARRTLYRRHDQVHGGAEVG